MIRTLASLLAAALAFAPASGANDDFGHNAEASGKVIRTDARVAERERDRDTSSEPDPRKRLTDYLRSAYCLLGRPEIGSDQAVDPCDTFPNPEDLPTCDDGDAWLQPLLRRTRATAGSAWGPWYVLSDWACEADIAPELTAEAFRELVVAPPELHMQPDRRELLVNMPTVVYSDDAVRTFETELLGYRFDVEARPTRYLWTFGDGTTRTTTSAGRPYPAKDVAHVYRRAGEERISLTVTWSGRYRVEGAGPWREVDGTATTTATTPLFEVVERRAHLESATCDEQPDARGC
ncbi:PKD domain-containing protein [Cellulomonas massiliensis]|uniref:PKD domain-containing protein n=1 Tax=Cellulomonas massiliensis TaxID=1465811 RepID=UPI0002D931DB|nr:PKD domain-containing protein [Cellulomonas massiliensis]